MKAFVFCFALCTVFLGFTAYANSQTVPVAGTKSPAAETTSPQPNVTEYTLPPGKLAKAEALYKTRTVLYLIGLGLGIVVLWVLLKLRVAPAIRNLAERASKNSFIQTAIFVPLLMLLIAIISLPIDIYEHHISRAYGLSVQAWGSWAGDWLKGEGVSLVLTVPMVFVLFLIIRKSPQRWWFYYWLLTVPLLVLLIFVAPVILDPIFNKFEPLEKTQPQLVSAIEKVTQRGGLNIPATECSKWKPAKKLQPTTPTSPAWALPNVSSFGTTPRAT